MELTVFWGSRVRPRIRFMHCLDFRVLRFQLRWGEEWLGVMWFIVTVSLLLVVVRYIVLNSDSDIHVGPIPGLDHNSQVMKINSQCSILWLHLHLMCLIRNS